MSDKRSLVAFTWTIATVLTLLAFLLAVILTCQVHAHYKRMERYYETLYTDDYYGNDRNCGGDGEEGGGGDCGSEDRNSEDRQINYLMQLSTISSKSMTFVALYTMAMAVALSLCGSTAIVGFTSLRGDYIAPCFSSSGPSKLRFGIFGGAIVLFANLLLVCAVVFGEVRVSTALFFREIVIFETETASFRSSSSYFYLISIFLFLQVEDWQDGRERGEDAERYEIEKLATILAVTCMFLAALYTVFSVLLFLFFGNEEDDDNHGLDQATSHNKPLVTISNDLRTDKFITMEDNST